MSFPKLPILLGVVGAIGATSLVAHAQTQNAPATQSSRSLTTVDAAGNVVLSPSPSGASSSVSSDRSRRNRNDSYRNGGIYYSPPLFPNYGYPYAPPVNNFYYPAQPTTTIIGQTNYSWQKPVTITSIPLGGYYGGNYGGYPAPAYPGYPQPGYPYPAPGYGFPAGGYGYPAPSYGYPVYGYPTYPSYGNTTTYIYGNAPGTIFSQSQNGGYGVSLGRGGLSVQIGNQRSTSTTTVTRY